MSYDAALARARDLIAKRDEIDSELSGLFGFLDQPKRGRPHKADNKNANGNEPDDTNVVPLA